MKTELWISLVLVLLFLTDISSLVSATSLVKVGENAYVAADGSVDPSKPPLPMIEWNRYHNYTEIVGTLLYLNTTYSDIVDVFPIGESWQNRTIYCVRLTNESRTQPKPEVFFVGYHHAREPISAELPLYFIVHAATNYGTNETLTHMFNFCEIYVVVALNPDGFPLFEVNDWQRKNAWPTDEDEDGLLDEDPPEDENEDGYIQLLFNTTTWEFIRWEGLDNDSDGEFGEDWVGGVDLNRNYGFAWNASTGSGSTNPSDEDYKGPAPFSEPETQALRDLVLQHNFKYAVSFHSGAEIIIYPWGYTTDPSPDAETFQEIGEDLSAVIGCPHGQAGTSLYTSSGSWDDWMYGNRSIIAFTCEIFSNNGEWFFKPGPVPDTEWWGGLRYAFNPRPYRMENVVLRWLPVFSYIVNRAVSEVHNVAVVDVVSSKTKVCQGHSISINVAVENQGSYTEIFNVTAYYNTTPINTTVVTLTGGNSTTVTFTWNTTGVEKGDYTISAKASEVPGETDTTDNTKVDGTVTVLSPGHDVGIKDVTSSKTVVGQNYSLSIRVTAKNYGNFTETFNVTAYYNSNVINYTTVTDLPPAEETIIVFPWNTTCVAKGTYNISAYATALPNETDIADNTYMDGVVQVVLPGDVNANGKVDMKDIGPLCICYDKEPCSDHCPCEYDINGDGKINMKDIGICTLHYGEEDP